MLPPTLVVSNWHTVARQNVTNQRGYCILLPNQLTFCSPGNAVEAVARWLSLLKHIVNNHEDCLHGELAPRAWLRKGLWFFLFCGTELLCIKFGWFWKNLCFLINQLFPLGSKVHKELALIVEKRNLLGDIPQLSPHWQTSELESFHRVICLFAPKSVHYFHSGMEARWVTTGLAQTKR